MFGLNKYLLHYIHNLKEKQKYYIIIVSFIKTKHKYLCLFTPVYSECFVCVIYLQCTRIQGGKSMMSMGINKQAVTVCNNTFPIIL